MAETITKTAQDEVLFLSNKAPELWLVRSGAEAIYSSAGTHLGDRGRVRYEFHDHQLRVRPGQDILPDGPLGEDGQPTEQDAVEWLRRHPGFNGMEANAFHEQGAEPDRVPAPGPALAAITEASIRGDVPALQELLADEREGFNREVVVEQAAAAIESVSAALAELDEAEAARAAENG